MGPEFREDWELGLNDPDAWGEDEQDKEPCVILNYRGGCQSCGLLVEIRERFPVTWEQPTNEPTGFVTSKPWGVIPVGWFVQAKPDGPWYEVTATVRVNDAVQKVWLRFPDGSEVWHGRNPQSVVTCRAGSLSNPIGDAVQALGDGVEILEDRP